MPQSWPSRELRKPRVSYAASAALGFLLAANIFSPSPTSAHHGDASQAQAAAASQPASERPSRDFSGNVATHDGAYLRLRTDLGSIVIHTHDSATIDYHVHLETDPSTKNAEVLLKSFSLHSRAIPRGVLLLGATSTHVPAGRLWVTLELTIPKTYSLNVSTGVGNITADDLAGRETLLTQGGNITAGNINGSARLIAVAGGHISVKNVTGELSAETGGGHITTGTVGGNAFLHTYGGHIRSDSIGGSAHLVTDGGNITLERAGADLVAETAGGQIQVGEAAGLVRAKTEGGGIRVARSSGPATLQTADGSIYVTQADNNVKASTATGGITAWFMSPPKDSADCDLQSMNGDIVVYLARTMPVTIDAQVEMGQTHGFIIDPAFPIQVQYDDNAQGQRVAHAAADLNGGGEVLHLRTVAGNIRFVLSDADKQMQIYRQQMEGLQRQFEELQQRLFPQSQR
ncbi:MAG TPA: hypothetical protein VJS43_09720 [Candidatus Acidoferrales bacterium]|nr:hypothetical protein [Candidatus Acidoferrales bacterium]